MTLREGVSDIRVLEHVEEAPGEEPCVSASNRRCIDPSTCRSSFCRFYCELRFVWGLSLGTLGSLWGEFSFGFC